MRSSSPHDRGDHRGCRRSLPVPAAAALGHARLLARANVLAGREGLARIADWVTSGDGGTPLAPWPACWAPAAATAARSSSAGLQVTSVAGLDVPRATQAIRGAPAGSARAAAAPGARSTWTPVTSLPIHRAGAAQLAWRAPGSRPQLPHVRDGPGA
jgi:hypothetical protein